MTTVAFLSGLGMMGRRHLKGLIRAGHDVIAFDPNPASADTARRELINNGLVEKKLRWVSEVPSGSYDVAVFAETARYRFQNVAHFLERSIAKRVLLEKPLSAVPQEFQLFGALFNSKRVSSECVSVNFPRRLWGFVARLRSLCNESQEVQITINGGAFGFGCNGIHYLDLFLYLAAGEPAKVRYVSLSPIAIASGRGPEYEDFGGCFVVETERVSMFCAGSPRSSASVTVSVRGDHFIAWIDESDMSWRLMLRRRDSSAPNYRYGQDYVTEAEGRVDVPALDIVTERWVQGEWQLPTLEESLRAHELLDRILQAGGATPPYRFT